MNLPLANMISVILTALSLVIFLAALRKANRISAMSHVMAHQVASSAANLQQALAVLQAERESCHDESVRLEARLRDSDRVRSEIARAIDLVEQAKSELNDRVRVTPAQQSPLVAGAPAVSADAAPVAPARTLPVFVNRIVRSADVASAVL
jgi:hypothetical protein